MPIQPQRFVSYLRVSTKKQGASGLGLEAQRDAIASFLRGGQPTREFIEIESGKANDRPQLAAAIREARLTGAKLLIAKLDRLSRNAAFLMGLRDAGVDFVACDVPEANTLTIGVLAVVAQHEREAIAARTKAALAAAKARGTKLGNPNGAAKIKHLGNAKAVEALRSKASSRAESYREIFDELDPTGSASARSVAEQLNARGILSPRRGSWQAISVIRMRERHAFDRD